MRRIFNGVLVIFITTGWVSGQVIPQDSSALVDLYNSTNGASWTNNSNWLSGNVSTWYGVTVANNRVLEVRLSQNNLLGSLPSSLGNLTGMSLLYLSSNNLSGAVPTSLSGLSSLEKLYLDRNQLVGPFPSQLQSISSLKELYLSYNNFYGTIPSSINNLANLQMIWLDGNAMSGTIPSSLMTMTALKFIALNGNNFTGTFPTGFAGLPNLELLYAHENGFSGSIPSDIGSATNLEEIWFHDNSMSGALPTSLSSLTNLVAIGVYENDFTGNIPDLGATAPNLNLAMYNDNNFDGIDGITNHANLGYLDIERNQLNFEDLVPVAGSISSNVYYGEQDSLDNIEYRNWLYLASVSDAQADNLYQWYRDGVETTGTNQGYFLFWQSGEYTCHVRNNIIRNLTLWRRPIYFNSLFGAPQSAMVAADQNRDFNGGDLDEIRELEVDDLIYLDNSVSSDKFVMKLHGLLSDNGVTGEGFEYRLTNSIGAIIRSGFGLETIDLSNQPNGMYYLTMVKDGGVIQKKLVKM